MSQDHTTASPQPQATPRSAGKYISRDLSWLKFNERVLDQAIKKDKNVFERFTFLAISATNLDEFFMSRVGSLYNYLDYKRQRIDNSGLREGPFRHKLLIETKAFFNKQQHIFLQHLLPLCQENGYKISKKIAQLSRQEQAELKLYFKKILFPILTPMVVDSHQDLPVLMNKVLALGVVTYDPTDKQAHHKYAFIPIPQNLPRFYEIKQRQQSCFIPIEEIIRSWVGRLFQNVTILSTTLLRVTRNSNFLLEESDDIEAHFLEELKRKLKKRKRGRVVRVELEPQDDSRLVALLKHSLAIDQDNFFWVPKDSLLDFTGLMQIVHHSGFHDPLAAQPVTPLSYPTKNTGDIFALLQQQDILLHHPYNSIDPVIDLIEQAAEDPHVLAIKLTLYRVAKDSAITATLLKAVNKGKHVFILFEVKVRFDEENNMQEAQKLEQAGCFVSYGVGSIKVHAKLMMIVRQEAQKLTCYVHISSGNYNEDTARFYTDLSLMTADPVYANDVSNFFNVITGYSLPKVYQTLITAPLDIRKQLIKMISKEVKNLQKGLPAGIVIKVNGLEDKAVIDALYQAAQAGLSIQLIVRGICCLIPGRQGLSENITVYSIVGKFLEHTRIFYFHNQGEPKVYVGSADIMVRNFERRIEALFLIKDKVLKRQVITVLAYNLKDNVNAYLMQEDGNYSKKDAGQAPSLDMHQEFFKLTLEEVMKTKLFG